jgi:hypothetical protein
LSVDSQSTISRAEVAQSVEQWTENPRVGGSIPSLGTKENQGFSWKQLNPFFMFYACLVNGLVNTLEPSSN